MKRFLIAPVLALTLAGPAAASDIQEDIRACGAMAEELGLLEPDTYSLRYVSDEGNRNRTLTLKALASDGEAPKLLACEMKRRKVETVVLAEAATR